MPVSPGRVVLVGVVVFLLAILAARLMLERTGVGMGIFFLLLPVMLLVLSLLVGWVLGLTLLVFFAGSAVAIRLLLVDAARGGLLLVLAPVLAVTVWLSLRVIRVLLGPGSEKRE